MSGSPWLKAAALCLPITLLGGSAPEAVKATWLSVGSTTNTCEDTFDYGYGGGMRIVACHLNSSITYSQLRQLAGMPVFLSGHGDQSMNLNNSGGFGRYNPEFVRWAGDTLIPGSSDPAFRDATQYLYNEHLSELARLHYLVWAKLQWHPECTAMELSQYTQSIESASTADAEGWGPFYERWYSFMEEGYCAEVPHHPLFNEGNNGNVTKTIVGFWMRRTMDGTAELWFANLTRLLETYDPAWLTERPLPVQGPPADAHGNPR